SLKIAAVDPDGEDRELMLRVRAIGVNSSDESDRLVVDETRERGDKWRQVCVRQSVREMRYLGTLHHREIEHEDLHRLLSARPWPEVREGDLATVWAERYRDPRKADEEESCCTRGVPIDTEEWVAARGTKPVQIATIGAHEEHPLLLRRESRQ